MRIGLKLFELLKGKWKFNRSLPEKGKVEGVADFKEIEKNTLHYQEQGHWKVAENQIYPITKNYIYRYHPDTDKISVYFAEPEKKGQLFYEMKISPKKPDQAIEATGVHQCADDHYQARYLFENNRFALFYQIKGPKKDYTLETLFEREEAVSWPAKNP